MFTGASLQIIKDCLEIGIANGYKDADEAQEIADFCDTNIKAVCVTCGGDGLMDVERDGTKLKDFSLCTTCDGTGKGDSFDALLTELGERNAKIQTSSDKKLKKAKTNGQE